MNEAKWRPLKNAQGEPYAASHCTCRVQHASARMSILVCNLLTENVMKFNKFFSQLLSNCKELIFYVFSDSFFQNVSCRPTLVLANVEDAAIESDAAGGRRYRRPVATAVVHLFVSACHRSTRQILPRRRRRRPKFRLRRRSHHKKRFADSVG